MNGGGGGGGGGGGRRRRGIRRIVIGDQREMHVNKKQMQA